MTTEDPVWRVRTRPCPFYQRGCCIFAANCNFLHANPKSKDSGYESDSSVRSLKSPEPMGHPPTPVKKPVVIIDSPRSVRSPPREPQMARLLSALSPVIGDEEDGEDEGEQYTDSVTLIEPDSATWSAGLSTLTHGADTTFFARVTETMAEMMRVTEGDHDDGQNTTLTLNQPDNNDPYDFSDSFFSNSYARSDPVDSGSPIESPSVSPQSLNASLCASPSNDMSPLPSSFHDQHDTPAIHTTHTSPYPVQIMEMPPIPDNHNDLLSPVDLSHLHLRTFSSVLDDSLDSWQDTSSIDSGFVDSTKPPFAQFMSPPKSPITSTFGLLHSPFGSPSSRVLSPRISAFIGRSPVSPLPDLANQSLLEDDLDSPSDRQPILPSPNPDGSDSTQVIATRVLLPPSPPSDTQDEDDEDQSSEQEELYDNLSDETSSSEEEDSGTEEDTQELESYGHTDIWATEDGSTSVYLGRQSPYDEQIEEDLNLQDSRSALMANGDISEPTWDDVAVSSPKTSVSATTSSPPRLPSSLQDEETSLPIVDDSNRPYSKAIRWSLKYEELSASNPDTTIEAIDYPLDDRFPEVPGFPETTENLRSPSPESTASPGYLEGDDNTVASNVNATAGIDDHLLDDRSPEVPGFPETAENLRSPSPESTASPGYLEGDDNTVASNVNATAGIDDYPLDDRSPEVPGFPEATENLRSPSPESTASLGYLEGDDNTVESNVNATAGIDDYPLDDHFPEVPGFPEAAENLRSPSPESTASPDYLEGGDNTVASNVNATAGTDDYPLDDRFTEVPGFLEAAGNLRSPSPESTASLGYLEGDGDTVVSNVNATAGTDDYLANELQDTQQFDSSDDSTALLEYLQPEAQEGDTLYSLYDVYTDMVPAAKSLPPSNPSTPASSLRERVFTPPPQKTPRYGTPPLQSPVVPSSPPTSVASLSKGRQTPQTTAESSQSQQSQDTGSTTSKKVPFGFRAHRSSRTSPLSNNRRSLMQIATNNVGVADEADQPNSSTPPSSASSAGSALRPLRLSVLLQSHSKWHSISHSSTAPSSITSFAVDSYAHPDIHESALLVPVSSRNSLLINNSLSTPRSAPHHTTSNRLIDSTRSPSLLTDDLNYLATFDSPISAPVSAPPHWPSHHRAHSYQQVRSSSQLSEPIYELEQEDEEDTTRLHDVRDETIRRPVGAPPRPAPITRPPSALRQSTYAIATPKPTLMFAIASDDVEQVRQVLESGDANPNDCVGPQSALAFALSNDQLTNKLNIVKTLLAFGADPSVLKEDELGNASTGEETGDAGEDQPSEVPSNQPLKKLMDGMDPATRYYVERAKAPQTRRTSALIHRSFFRPLTRVQYDLIGQDRALEELFKLLSIHSRRITVSPLVVMFSGPSGHGKSLLARKFGSLLDVPTHTVNMVTLRSQDDLWESYSVDPLEEPTNCTLAEFLVNNEGKRCVVVLDEIEKVANEKVLWSLLMPWEHGRCSFEARSRHVDVRNVIWLCTSNIGQDLVFNHWNAREYVDEVLTRQEFLGLVALLRPLVSERLGASVLSRITSVLPFVPFTLEEKRAMSAEAVFQLGGEDALALSPQEIESLIHAALSHYIPEEGARSLHRAVSNHLVDMI